MTCDFASADTGAGARVPEPPTRTWGQLLRRAQQVHTSIWADTFAGEVTGPQYAVLAALALRPGITQRRIGELTSLDKSSTADIVDRLLAGEWLRRERDILDARKNTVQLSSKAAVTLRRFTPLAAEVQEQLLQPLPTSQRPLFLENLRQIARLDQLSVEDAPADHPLALRLSRTPGHLIRRAQQIHTSLWAHHFARQLTEPQFSLLHALSQRPAISQLVLGQLAALDKSNVAEIVARTVGNGWLKRSRDREDRRRSTLVLTEAGARVHADSAPRVATIQRELLAPLDFNSGRDLVRDLATVARASDDAP